MFIWLIVKRLGGLALDIFTRRVHGHSSRAPIVTLNKFEGPCYLCWTVSYGLWHLFGDLQNILFPL